MSVDGDQSLLIDFINTFIFFGFLLVVAGRSLYSHYAAGLTGTFGLMHWELHRKSFVFANDVNASRSHPIQRFHP